MITTLVATIFVFGLLVFVHELGHFITAKMTGMRVSEFAIGFGPKLLWKRWGETEYSLRIIPLGGYNKIDGMDPEEDLDERSFCRKPVWARAVVIAAGSVMNFILPVILFTVIFLSNGIENVSDKPVIGALIPGKPAMQSGLNPGDKVLEKIRNCVSWRAAAGSVNSGGPRPANTNSSPPRRATRSEPRTAPCSCCAISCKK